MGSADEAVVLAFNAAINRRDLSGLGRLMADGHRFIDTAGNTFAGKPAGRRLQSVMAGRGAKAQIQTAAVDALGLPAPAQPFITARAFGKTGHTGEGHAVLRGPRNLARAARACHLLRAFLRPATGGSLGRLGSSTVTVVFSGPPLTSTFRPCDSA